MNICKEPQINIGVFYICYIWVVCYSCGCRTIRKVSSATLSRLGGSGSIKFGTGPCIKCGNYGVNALINTKTRTLCA